MDMSNNQWSAISEWASSCLVDPTPSRNLDHPQYPPFGVAKDLFEQFYISVETFTPIVGRPTGDADLLSLYSTLEEGRQTTNHLAIRPNFRAQMILAISLRIMTDVAQPDQRSRSSNNLASHHYAEASEAIFIRASSHLRQVLGTSRGNYIVGGGGGGRNTTLSHDELETEEALEKLQIVLLLVHYLILSPTSGNVWQILGFAERLWRSIMRREPRESFPTPLGEAGSLPSMLYDSFVILERWVGTTFGRTVNWLDDDDDGDDDGSGDATGSRTKTIPRLFRQILGIKAWIHAYHQSHHQVVTATGNGSSTTIDVNRVKVQVAAWLDDYAKVVEANDTRLLYHDYDPGAVKAWLLAVGGAMAGETTLLAVCLRWQENPIVISYPESLLSDGREVILSLLKHYCFLSTRSTSQAQSSSSQRGLAQVTMPFSWPWAMEVFRLAVAAAYISRFSSSSSLKPTLEMTTAIQLLKGNNLWDTCSLVEAMQALSASTTT
jgi:hypothetical protein